MNSVISTCLLYYPKDKATFKQLKEVTNEIYKHIKDKDLKTNMSACPQNLDIKDAALSLGFSVKGNPTDRKKGDEAVLIF